MNALLVGGFVTALAAGVLTLAGWGGVAALLIVFMITLAARLVFGAPTNDDGRP